MPRDEGLPPLGQAEDHVGVLKTLAERCSQGMPPLLAAPVSVCMVG